MKGIPCSLCLKSISWKLFFSLAWRISKLSSWLPIPGKPMNFWIFIPSPCLRTVLSEWLVKLWSCGINMELPWSLMHLQYTEWFNYILSAQTCASGTTGIRAHLAVLDQRSNKRSLLSSSTLHELHGRSKIWHRRWEISKLSETPDGMIMLSMNTTVTNGCRSPQI